MALGRDGQLSKTGISAADWEAICGIALLYGGDESRIHATDAPITKFLAELGPPAARLSGHRFPVYCWEVSKSARSARAKLHVIDQGEHRFSFEVRRSR